MPSFQNVSYNSSRVQRAYRINSIESLKLKNKIQLLEKERLHNQRLTNQDIRLISLTLDYIQTCSGHSAEGLGPEGESEEEEEERTHEGPTFLYGERIVSRKKRRNLRPQSALDRSSSRLNSETASSVSVADVNLRPQSSPIRRKPTFVTHLRDDESVFGSSSESNKSGLITPNERFKPSWLDEPMSNVTKILLRAASGNKRRESVFDRTRNIPGSLPGLRSLRRSSSSGPQGLSSSSGAESARERSHSIVPERGTRITDILNRGPKATMSANAWKSHLSNSQAAPVSSSLHRQYIMDSKKEMNKSRSETIDKKVKRFIAETD